MGTNGFLVFDENRVNLLTDSEYQNSDYRKGGAVSGIAPSNIHNKLYLQTSLMSAALAQVIADTGQTVSDGSKDTLVAQLKALLGGTNYGSIRYETPGTFQWTVPSNCNQVVLNGCGGGGGGNGNYGLPGGGAECIMNVKRTVTPGEVLTIVVGTGGAGAAGSATVAGSIIAGGNGANTTITGSFGVITIAGGKGGLSNYSSNSKLDPGAAGGPGGGRGGFPASYSTDNRYIRAGGKGGDTLFGSGGQGGLYPDAASASYGTKVNGEKGIGFGSGGGGGGHIFDSSTVSTGGGDGAGGMVMIEWKLAAS